MRVSKLALVLMVALALATAIAGTALGSARLVDERALLNLTGVDGAAGTADIRLRIRDVGIIDLFRARLDATGLTPGGNYDLLVGMNVMARTVADAAGRATIDQVLAGFSGNTLVGTEIRLVSVETGISVLSGTVLQTNLVPDVTPVPVP